jgi:hypothetical protein
MIAGDLGGFQVIEKTAELQVGVVIRKQPGVTRWAKWVWNAVAVLPGAGPADWREIRREGEAVEYHAATLTMEVHRDEAEGYLVALTNNPPCVYVVLRPSEDPEAEHEVEVFLVTASAFEAQDYNDSGEEIVEAVPMPASLRKNSSSAAATGSISRNPRTAGAMRVSARRRMSTAAPLAARQAGGLAANRRSCIDP